MERILHITGGMERAGAETMVMNLYRAIDRTKFQFDFLYFTNKECDFDQEIKELGGKIYRITAANPFKRMKATQRLLEQNPQWETVHAHMLFSNAFHLYAAYKAGINQRITHAHNTSDPSKNKLTAKIYQSASRKVQAKYATDFVACGVEAGKFLFPYKTQVPVIPNAIDTQKFAAVAEQSQNHLKNEFDLEPDELVLLQIGTFGPQKNHQFSIKIAEVLKKQDVKFKLFFAGRGPLQEVVADKVKNLGLEEEIKLLGVRSDIAKLMGGADLMLMPSLHEGFPVVLVESQTAGLPALIADTISDEVDLGTKLIFFESLENSPELWVRKIQQMTKQKRHTETKRLEILKEQGFDIFTNAQELEKLYNRS